MNNWIHLACSLNTNCSGQLLYFSWVQQTVDQILCMWENPHEAHSMYLFMWDWQISQSSRAEHRYRESSFTFILMEPANKDSSPQRTAWWQAVQKKVWKAFLRICQRRELCITNCVVSIMSSVCCLRNTNEDKASTTKFNALIIKSMHINSFLTTRMR